MKLTFPFSPRILIIRYNLVPRDFWLFCRPRWPNTQKTCTEEDHSGRIGVFDAFYLTCAVTNGGRFIISCRERHKFNALMTPRQNDVNPIQTVEGFPPSRENWITSKPFKLWPPNLANFPKKFLGTCLSHRDVYVNNNNNNNNILLLFC